MRSLIPAAALAVALLAFLVADRQWLHVYTPDVSALEARLDAQAMSISAREAESRSAIAALTRRVDEMDQNVQNLLDTTTNEERFEGIERDQRLSTAVTLLALLSSFGGFQSTASPEGRACQDYLMFGEGDVTACGFESIE